ncbi:probable receptor-like protein kinase At5g24010 [Corylus avellana]|uniref:probable receptor-like protein kinase At5g24010 n=1 Tax=Corylus avellana TaxID=13451 RepID=UPI00286B0645|nr:probable receptor-like protein kinase At5g24010 [Corylus avellana]XP_059456488.1 probable receptor-like protein kinase At5g24010 [Corylus avellana]
MNPGTFSVGKSYPISAKAATNNPLYQTARIFLNPSSYEFDIIDHGVYYVRLHFYPYMIGKANVVANISFNVSVTNSTLLSEFSAKQTNNLPVIEEFLVTIFESKFSINFIPEAKSLAFVNAIEVFLFAPNLKFLLIDIPVVSGRGISRNYSGDGPDVLHTLHRINVGGPLHNDSLWRTWIPDDPYVPDLRYGKNCPAFKGALRYNVLDASKDSASDLVYSTCKELSIETGVITWQLDVSKSTIHMLRLHFCDIVSTTAAVAKFDLTLYEFYAGEIYATDGNQVERLDAPFYYDFLIESDALGLAIVTITPRADSKSKNAYLNGIEVFELTKRLN